jgi:outer membrane usher protein
MLNRRCVYLSIFLFLFNLSHLHLAEGGQMAILRFVLNQEEKGEFFVNVTDDGDFLVRIEDLKKMGFSEVHGKISVLEGEEFVSLKSMEGIKTVFDEKKLALELTADPHLLSKQIFTLRYPRQAKVYYPKDMSGFLNYNVTYFARDSFTYDRTQLANQLGFRVEDFLFLSDSSYTLRRGEEGQFVRLMSNITYDRREDFKRMVIGDFFASSGELGSTQNMGGISFSKNYSINPYFIKYPEISFSGIASLPSELEVYRDGVLIRKERIAPGGFDLKDIPTYVGSGNIEVVLRDAFGKEQRIRLPYYFSDILLKKGLQEYSYNVGFSREDFGSVSNHYKDFSFLGFHRYGMSDSLTAGINAEASKRVLNLGLSSAYLLPGRLGVISASMAWSDSRENGDGIGGSVSYLNQGKNLSFSLLFRGFTRDYSNISIETTQDRKKYETSIGASYFSSSLGSFSLGFDATKKYIGSDTKSLLASYTRNITDRSNVIASFKRDIENRVNAFNVSINYYFNYGITASSSYQRTDGNSSERIQVTKNLPLGEGFGGRASFEANQTEFKNFNNYDLQLQYNAKYGQYGGEFISTDGREAYLLTAGGGFTFVKDTLDFGRPVQDSFAVVKVGDLKGVRVYLSNQEMGRTGSSGEILIPNLGSYYENQISISDKDIPIEYTLSEITKYVSPPLRSGSYIEFGATKIQSLIGTFKIKVGQEIKPLEYVEFKLIVEGKELLSSTGKGGEFYLENIKPGKYRGELKFMDQSHFFDIMIPKSEDQLVDLGEIICE